MQDEIEGSSKEKGAIFEREVAAHYRALGYSVTMNVPIAGKAVDILATTHMPDGQTHSVMIECKFRAAGYVGIEDVLATNHVYELAKSRNLVQACAVVTTYGFSIPAQTAAKDAGVHVVTFDDLVLRASRMPDGLARLLSQTYQSRVAELPCFITGQGTDRTANRPVGDVVRYLYTQALQPQPSITFLVGGVGTGKTTQLFQLAAAMTDDYLARNAVPAVIYLPLERFKRHRVGIHFDEFAVEYLRRQFPYPLLSWTDILRWLNEKTAILVLDGLDEIQDLRSPDQVIEEYQHILGAVGPSCNVIIAGRSGFARLPEDDTAVTELALVILDEHRRQAVIDLSPFSDSDIAVYLERVQASRAIKRYVSRTTADLLRRPLFLRLLAVTWATRSLRHHFKTDSEVLQAAISYLLRYRTHLRSAEITTAEWRQFVRECAFRMWREDARILSVEGLRLLVTEFFGSGEDVERIDKIVIDGQVRTVFDFDLKEKGLVWSHQIFRDFLAAEALALRLLRPGVRDLEVTGRTLSEEQVRYLRYWVDRFGRDFGDLSRFRRPPAEPMALSDENGWCWIAPGLSVVRDSSTLSGAVLRFFERGFWISRHPITVGDLEALGLGETITVTGARRARLSAQAPVTHISQEEARLIASKLGGRLPTEAEWERAALWIDGSRPLRDEVPNADERRSSPPLVGAGRPNAWGVCNATGCVWQWTTTFDAEGLRFVCKGAWWGAPMAAKLDGTTRLAPRAPDHLRTGVRVVCDPSGDGVGRL